MDDIVSTLLTSIILEVYINKTMVNIFCKSFVAVAEDKQLWKVCCKIVLLQYYIILLQYRYGINMVSSRYGTGHRWPHGALCSWFVGYHIFFDNHPPFF
jgi:hypothetical protein